MSRELDLLTAPCPHVEVNWFPSLAAGTRCVSAQTDPDHLLKSLAALEVQAFSQEHGSVAALTV